MLNDLCPHFGRCGGCSTQNRPYSAQLAEKESAVRAELGDLRVLAFAPIQPSPQVWFYRNKMEFSFGDARDIAIFDGPPRRRGDASPPADGSVTNGGASPDGAGAAAPTPFPAPGRVHVGLHPKGRFSLVLPTPECRIFSRDAWPILDAVGSWARSRGIPAYLRKNNTGVLRHLLIREGKNTGERLVALYSTSALTPQDLDAFAGRLRALSVPVTTCLWVVNDTLSDVAAGSATRVLWGDGMIHERFLSLRLRVPPQSFMQTNTHAAEEMLTLLSSWLAEDEAALGRRVTEVVDLYCGGGVIGLTLAKDARRVIGIESNPAAVREAEVNARDNQVSDARFLLGRAEVFAKDLGSHVGDAAATAVVVDPPRPGLLPPVIDAIFAIGAPCFYYVSCNPRSLARDLRVLVSRYTIERVQPMDFFPHTDHVETLVKLRLT